MGTYLSGIREVFLCRKCGYIEVEEEGDMCVDCMASQDSGYDPETAREEVK